MATVTCPVCLQQNEAGSKRCWNCAEPLPQPAPAPAAPAPAPQPPVDDAPTSDPFASLVRLVLPSGRIVDLLPGDRLELGRAASSPLSSELPDNVSRRHAEISIGIGEVWVDDLSSTNGTWVDDQAVQPGRPQLVRAGSVIRLAANPAYVIRVEQVGS